MKIKMNGEYEVQTDVDCFEKHYGLCEYYIPDSDCRYVIAHEMAKEYEPKDKEKQKEIRTAFNWLLDEIDYKPGKNDEDFIKDYYDTQAMKEDLEILDVIEQDED